MYLVENENDYALMIRSGTQSDVPTINAGSNTASTLIQLDSREYKFCFDYAPAAWTAFDATPPLSSTDTVNFESNANTYLQVDLLRTGTGVSILRSPVRVQPGRFRDTNSLKCPNNDFTNPLTTLCELDYDRRCFSFTVDVDENGNEFQDESSEISEDNEINGNNGNSESSENKDEDEDLSVVVVLSGGFLSAIDATVLNEGLLYGTFDNLELSYCAPVPAPSPQGPPKKKKVGAVLVGAGIVAGLVTTIGAAFAYKSKYSEVAQSSLHQKGDVEATMFRR